MEPKVVRVVTFSIPPQFLYTVHYFERELESAEVNFHVAKNKFSDRDVDLTSMRKYAREIISLYEELIRWHPKYNGAYTYLENGERQINLRSLSRMAKLFDGKPPIVTHNYSKLDENPTINTPIENLAPTKKRNGIPRESIMAHLVLGYTLGRAAKKLGLNESDPIFNNLKYLLEMYKIFLYGGIVSSYFLVENLLGK